MTGKPMISPEEREGLREKIARIIDPHAWSLWADDGPFMWSDLTEGQWRVRADSLAKADLILSALSSKGEEEVLSTSRPSKSSPSDVDHSNSAATAAGWPESVGFAPWLWANPALDPVGDKPALAEARIRAPMNVAQPFTPNQYALVLRWDLITWWHEIVWRRAQVESLRHYVFRLEAERNEMTPKRGAAALHAVPSIVKKLADALDTVLSWAEEHGGAEWPDYDDLVNEVLALRAAELSTGGGPTSANHCACVNVPMGSYANHMASCAATEAALRATEAQHSAGLVDALDAENDRLCARLAELETALIPFALTGAVLEAKPKDSAVWAGQQPAPPITFGHLRAAARIIAASQTALPLLPVENSASSPSVASAQVVAAAAPLREVGEPDERAAGQLRDELPSKGPPGS